MVGPSTEEGLISGVVFGGPGGRKLSAVGGGA